MLNEGSTISIKKKVMTYRQVYISILKCKNELV